MHGQVIHTGDAIIHLDKKSTDVLLGKKTPEEIAKIKAERERDRQERAAREAAQRAADEAALKAKREALKAERAEIENADKLLQAALDTYHATLQDAAGAARTREELAVAVENLKRKLAEARATLEQAQVRFDAANASHEAAVAKLADLDNGVIAKLPNAKDALRAAWEANETTWAKAAPAKRKAERDRALKNRVKSLLGLKAE